jgi:uncharacterized protein (DUF433 family)
MQRRAEQLYLFEMALVIIGGNAYIHLGNRVSGRFEILPTFSLKIILMKELTMEKQVYSIDHLLERISINPKVMVGKPVIRGTRIPIELIVKMLAQGISEQEILREYPRLKADDIKAALAYASVVLSNEEIFPIVETELAR